MADLWTCLHGHDWPGKPGTKGQPHTGPKCPSTAQTACSMLDLAVRKEWLRCWRWAYAHAYAALLPMVRRARHGQTLVINRGVSVRG